MLAKKRFWCNREISSTLRPLPVKVVTVVISGTISYWSIIDLCSLVEVANLGSSNGPLVMWHNKVHFAYPLSIMEG